MDSNTIAESDVSLNIQIILAQGEWSSAKDAGPILKRCNTRQQQTFFNMVNVYVFNIGSICFHRKELLRNFYAPSKIQGTISQWNRCSTHLRNWYPNNQTRSMEWIQLAGRILHGTINLWLVRKKSSVYRMQRFMYFQILYYVLAGWTRTHNQILLGKTSWRGSKVHQNTKLWTQLMVSQWNSSGIFSQDSPHCSSATKSKRSCQKWAKRFHTTDHLHDDV